MTVATTAVVGSSQVYNLSLPTNDLYYIVLWSQDEVGEWSDISNTTSATPALINRSVTVTVGDPYLFGSLAVGSSSHTATAITLLNDGNIASTYSLSAATSTVGSPWSIGTALPTAADVVVVSGGFHGSRPALGAFGPEDVITGIDAPSSATKFSLNGTATGVSVPVAATRDIWFRLDMPTTSATESPQSVTVTVTAGP